MPVVMVQISQNETWRHLVSGPLSAYRNQLVTLQRPRSPMEVLPIGDFQVTFKYEMGIPCASSFIRRTTRHTLSNLNPRPTSKIHTHLENWMEISTYTLHFFTCYYLHDFWSPWFRINVNAIKCILQTVESVNLEYHTAERSRYALYKLCGTTDGVCIKVGKEPRGTTVGVWWVWHVRWTHSLPTACCFPS